MMKTELEGRTLAFSVSVIRFVGLFGRGTAVDVVGRQLVKAATSIGANYREANRSESGEDFIHKTGIAEKEAAETCYWLEICLHAGLAPEPKVLPLLDEARQLLAILTTINRKSKRR
jgi:four helix bundle protein